MHKPILFPMSKTYSRLFYVLLSLIISHSLLAQQSSDIRQVRWGFSPKQVKEAEKEKLTSSKADKLVYARVPLINRKMGLEYAFNGDSLLSASYYYYTTAGITEADVTAASNELEGLLREKYGPGKTKRVDELQTVNWLTPRTQITLTLGKVDRGWSMELMYLCRVCSGDPVPKSSQVWKPLKEIQDL
ncbi:hypothetical protein [Spirosoma gilvum]